MFMHCNISLTLMLSAAMPREQPWMRRFAFSLISFLAGSLHVPHVHLPHLHFDLHHGFHFGHGHGHSGGDTPWFNIATISVFLTWFGGTGYLLQRYASIWAVLALGVSALAGIGGAAIVFLFLAKYQPQDHLAA